MADPLEFLRSVFGGDRPIRPVVPSMSSLTRPYVTLTFAQSLDAKIAGIGGKQLILSGKESMVMTHWMRTMHDGLLVGIGTALNDDPQLNTRHLPERVGEERSKPRPIILDTNLRLPVDCKLLKNFREGNGRRPWILCSERWQDSERRQELEGAGARVILVKRSDCEQETGLDITSVLATLRTLGIETLMVEGGAKVIGTFLEGASRMVDTVIMTIAPGIVGKEGTGYESQALENGRWIRTAQIGRDTVVGLEVRRNAGF